MKNAEMSETMRTLMRKSVCVMLSLLLLLSAVFPVKAAEETTPAEVVRVGSFEDTFMSTRRAQEKATVMNCWRPCPN